VTLGAETPKVEVYNSKKEKAIPLSEWCRREGITEGNARGWHIPKGNMPGAFKVGTDWYCTECSTLPRRGGGRKRGGAGTKARRQAG